MAAVADFSKLLQEWDYEKNTLLPTEITTGSNKKPGGNVVGDTRGKLLLQTG